MIGKLIRKLAEMVWKHLHDTHLDQLQHLDDLATRMDRLQRDLDNLVLDMDALYDKVKAALGRISQRERRAKADTPDDEANGRPSALDDINQQILDGTYGG